MKFVDAGNLSTIEDINDYLEFSSGGYYTLVVYHSLATLLGIVGNSLLLYGSMKFKVMSIDRISTVLIEAVAILDMLFVISFMIPVWATLIGKRWVLGTVGCYIQGIIGYTTTLIEMSVITGISCYRFYALSFPLSARALSSGLVKRSMAGLSCFVVLYLFCSHFIGQYFFFSPRLISCQHSGITSSVIYTWVGAILFMAVPLLTIVISNIGILIIVTKSNYQKGRLTAEDTAKTEKKSELAESLEKLRKNLPSRKAVIMVSCVALTFVFSLTPVLVRLLLQASQVKVEPWFVVMSLEMLCINGIANPIVYTVINGRFRKFASKSLRRIGTGRVRRVINMVTRR